ncbi:TrmH family RNA methyltransferase [Synechocystis sp. PCC 7509]|uniref:TrmH family RNA methyltransferase n=1 Tax=Synechocystis sp. PCC 7509 TaxID=927677 RepID=UPI0002ACFE38|nr:RNA methyltransferase [Synechocystis sp. PCC 7509]
MLTSLQNPFVKQLRKLHSAKERKEQNLFLLEGTHLIESACAVDYPLVSVCCTEQWQANHQNLWENLVLKTDRLEIVSAEVLKVIATTVNPDGIIATAKRKDPHETLPCKGLLLALETVQDPGNLGTIIRTCAAAGAAGLWLSSDSVDLDHPKVLRASAGQWFRLPMAVSDNLSATCLDYQKSGIQIVSTTANAKLTYWELDLQRPTLILLGNEGAGLSNQLLEIADKQVSIPLNAGVESVNVAIAAALLLYEAQRQQWVMGNG